MMPSVRRIASGRVRIRRTARRYFASGPDRRGLHQRQSSASN